ncbi:MAG TPA: TonB-dependent receptor plug domain-containing protein [Sphingobium sp.]
MKYHLLVAAAAPFVFPMAVGAQTTANAQGSEAPKKVFITGVAKGRDLLASAISASALDEAQVERLSARSLPEILRSIPGIRAEATGDEANANYTIRGLPLASAGSKYVQFQEDGLPVLEFGDMTLIGMDSFLRTDLGISQIQTIRGGSASTFSSNSPGGVINFISNTGSTDGGDVQLSSGLDFELYRLDFNYGGRIADGWRFNVAGFYRQGEGVRKLGYDGLKGGQFKFNVTRDLAGTGYIRIYAKYLDDRTPTYPLGLMRATGSDASPSYQMLANFDPRKDTLLSPYLRDLRGLDINNNVTREDLADGIHSVVKSVGVEAQFDVSGWTVSEKFRFADMSMNLASNYPTLTAGAGAMVELFGGAGSTLKYVTGPNAGRTIVDLANLNDNGLLALSVVGTTSSHTVNNITNDLRASRTMALGGGDLTTTAGIYFARQSLGSNVNLQTRLMDVRGGGQAALLDVSDAAGNAITQGGVFTYFLCTEQRSLSESPRRRL